MQAEIDEAEEKIEAGDVATVARSVLSLFFNKLAVTDGFAEVAPKLRATVLDKGQFSEAAIKAAMFPDGS